MSTDIKTWQERIGDFQTPKPIDAMQAEISDLRAALAAKTEATTQGELLNIGSMKYQGRSITDWVLAAKAKAAPVMTVEPVPICYSRISIAPGGKPVRVYTDTPCFPDSVALGSIGPATPPAAQVSLVELASHELIAAFESLTDGCDDKSWARWENGNGRNVGNRIEAARKEYYAAKSGCGDAKNCGMPVAQAPQSGMFAEGSVGEELEKTCFYSWRTETIARPGWDDSDWLIYQKGVRDGSKSSARTEQDAARYQWLREAPQGESKRSIVAGTLHAGPLRAADLDAAIDAAIAAKSTKEPT
jgi:hypothetical protein